MAAARNKINKNLILKKLQKFGTLIMETLIMNTFCEPYVSFFKL